MKNHFRRHSVSFLIASIAFGFMSCDALKNKNPIGGNSGGGSGGKQPQAESELRDPVSIFTSTLVGSLEEWNPTVTPGGRCGRANVNAACVTTDRPRKRIEYNNCVNAYDTMVGFVSISYSDGAGCFVGTADRSANVTQSLQKSLNSGLTLQSTSEVRSVLGDAIGGGVVLSPLNTGLTLWKLRVSGLHYDLKNGLVSLSSDSIYTPTGSEFSITTVDFTRTARVVNTGKLRLVRSATDVQLGTFTNLQWGDPNCCFPTTGTLRIQPSGASTATMEVTYLPRCGAYEIRYQSGQLLAGELTYCGGSAQW